MNGPHGPFFRTIWRPQLSQNSSSGASSAPGALRSGLAAKFSFVKSQLKGSAIIFLPNLAASLIACVICLTSETSSEKFVTSSTIALMVIGKPNDAVTFLITALGSFFHGPAAIVIGLVLVKLLHE